MKQEVAALRLELELLKSTVDDILATEGAPKPAHVRLLVAFLARTATAVLGVATEEEALVGTVIALEILGNYAKERRTR